MSHAHWPSVATRRWTKRTHPRCPGSPLIPRRKKEENRADEVSQTGKQSLLFQAPYLLFYLPSLMSAEGRRRQSMMRMMRREDKKRDASGCREASGQGIDRRPRDRDREREREKQPNVAGRSGPPCHTACQALAQKTLLASPRRLKRTQQPSSHILTKKLSRRPKGQLETKRTALLTMRDES